MSRPQTGTEHFNAILIEIISECKGTDIISDHQSKREQIIVHTNSDIRLQSVVWSDAVAYIKTNSPPFRLLPYRVGDSDDLMPWVDVDAIQSWIVATDPCCVCAISISFLRNWYLHINAICAAYLHSITFGWQSLCYIPHHNTIHGDGVLI